MLIIKRPPSLSFRNCRSPSYRESENSSQSVEDIENHEYESESKIYETTIGRILLWEVVPAKLNFDLVNKPMAKRAISEIIDECYRHVGLKDTVIFADQLMYMDLNIVLLLELRSVNDFIIPDDKNEIIEMLIAK